MSSLGEGWEARLLLSSGHGFQKGGLCLRQHGLYLCSFVQGSRGSTQLAPFRGLIGHTAAQIDETLRRPSWLSHRGSRCQNRESPRSTLVGRLMPVSAGNAQSGVRTRRAGPKFHPSPRPLRTPQTPPNLARRPFTWDFDTSTRTSTSILRSCC